MSLTKEERGTLFQFLWLYLGSSFTLFAVIAYLFYQNELHYFYDTLQSNMQLESNKIASKITHAHMKNEDFSFHKEIENSQYKLGFFDKYDTPIASNISSTNDSKSVIFKDSSTFGHLGVEYILIEKEGVDGFITNLRYKIIGILLFIYIIIGIIGYFLAKLFLKPIQLKRVQLDNFIKDSTHELNTPITALLLSINSPLLNSPRNLERIRLSATRISEIHKDLTYLMVENRSPNINRAIELNRIIEKKLLYLKALADKKGITIDVIYRDKLYFKIDEESFTRVINNLISNAIKYNIPNGTIQIVVNKNSIIVQDSGIGIAQEKQKEIYKRFYRATTQAGGFGLGLNIVYNIANNYGIKIEMSSKLNQGTTFKLIF